jgi:DNA polymerase-3 subunit delta'
MDYKSIRGHEKIISNLKSVVKNNRINHAYIFDGDAGMGKTMLAKAFAKTLLCQNGGDEPCGECNSCRSFDSLNNPDVIYVTHEKKQIVVDDIRNQVVRQAAVKPFMCNRKVFIIDEADLMRQEAQNALLKTLEEPPDYVTFLLLCENVNKLLVTILSRCVLFKLHPLPDDEVKDYLMSVSGADEHTANYCTAFAKGSIGKAAQLYGSEDFNDIRDFAVETLLKLEKSDMTGMYKLLSEVDKYKSDITQVLEIMLLTYRDALVLLSSGSKFVVQKDKLSLLGTLSQKGSAALINACAALEGTMSDLRGNVDFQLSMEKLFFNLKT